MPIAAKPTIASATMVSVTSLDDESDDEEGSVGLAARSRVARRAFTVPTRAGDRAMSNAPSPATTLKNTATICVSRRPANGTSAKSVNRHPRAAPAVLTP
jgi:hypothetical protein